MTEPSPGRQPPSPGDLYYGEYYTTTQRAGLCAFGNGLLDRSVERFRGRLADGRRPSSRIVLELGSSSGEHLGFVDPNSFDHWVGVDLAPGATRPRLLSDRSRNPRTSFVAADAHSLPFRADAFDEVVATCLLHHVRDPEAVMGEISRVLRPGGTFVAAMPTDPGVLNRLVKRVATFPLMRRAGIQSPELVYAREHVNAINRIVTLFGVAFQNFERSVRFLPLGGTSWNLNLFVVVWARKPHKSRSAQALEGRVEQSGRSLG